MLHLWDYQYRYKGRWYAGSVWAHESVDAEWVRLYMMRRTHNSAHSTLTLHPTHIFNHLGVAYGPRRISARGRRMNETRTEA
jgi:hypothetical protein